jgi:acyl dehydratase
MTAAAVGPQSSGSRLSTLRIEKLGARTLAAVPGFSKWARDGGCGRARHGGLTAPNHSVYLRRRRRREAMGEAFHGEYDVYVGRDMGGHDYTITPDLVQRYAAGTEDHNPWYHGDSPLGGPVAPALLLHSEVYTNLAWYLPNLIGNLHAKQEWELFQPMMVGDAVRTHSTIVERYLRRNREYVVNEVLIVDQNGRWLQRSRTHQSFLIAASSQPSAAAAAEGAAGFVVDKEREKRPERTFVVGDGPGPDLPPLSKTITIGMCQAFSGPHRSYHTDREMAQALGFPDIVVQGMMSVCFLSELMTTNFGLGWLCGGKMNVSLVNVVWPNDTLSVRARARETVPEGAKSRVHLDIWCEKADGVKTIVGSASALR